MAKIEEELTCGCIIVNERIISLCPEHEDSFTKRKWAGNNPADWEGMDKWWEGMWEEKE